MEDAIFKDVWKFIFILAVLGLFYFLNKYASNIEKSIEKLTDMVSDLREMVKIHEHRHNDTDDKIEDHDRQLKEIHQYKVKYGK
jgi:hypothetical protein